MSLVLQQNMLIDEISLDEQMKFVETHLDKLENLLGEDVYSETKSQLNELKRVRGKALFPEWYT